MATNTKKRGGGRYVRLPSDNLTKKEREALNGEVKTYKDKEFYTWEEFKELPDDLQIKHINSLINRYDVSIRAISKEVFGLSECGLAWHIKNHNMKQYINATPVGKAGLKGKEKMVDALAKYKTRVKEQIAVEEPVIGEATASERNREKATDPEEAPQVENMIPAVYKIPEKPKTADFHNIALLLQSLAGTGAKLTIEVTL